MAAKEVQKNFRISGERGTKPVGYTAKQERPESMKETKIVNKTQQKQAQGHHILC